MRLKEKGIKRLRSSKIWSEKYRIIGFLSSREYSKN